VTKKKPKIPPKDRELSEGANLDVLLGMHSCPDALESESDAPEEERRIEDFIQIGRLPKKKLN
jgi:hypothetical protein